MFLLVRRSGPGLPASGSEAGEGGDGAGGPAGRDRDGRGGAEPGPHPGEDAAAGRDGEGRDGGDPVGAKRGLNRVVLDANVLVSALLFGGRLEPIRRGWRTGRIRPVLSKEIADEPVRGLAYPKFRLTREEISALLKTELLPYVGVVGG